MDSIISGMAIYVADGSYHRSMHADLDGASWLVYCTAHKKIVYKGSAYEVNKHAASYRGELLGMLALHVLILGVTEFFDVADKHYLGLMACDNLGDLTKRKRGVVRLELELNTQIFSAAFGADMLV